MTVIISLGLSTISICTGPTISELDGNIGRKSSYIWAGTMGYRRFSPNQSIESAARYRAFRFTISVRAPRQE